MQFLDPHLELWTSFLTLNEQYEIYQFLAMFLPNKSYVMEKGSRRTYEFGFNIVKKE